MVLSAYSQLSKILGKKNNVSLPPSTTVPPFSTYLGGSLVYSELPLSQMSIDAGWPCLWLLAFCAGCWRAVQ